MTSCAKMGKINDLVNGEPYIIFLNNLSEVILLKISVRVILGIWHQKLQREAT